VTSPETLLDLITCGEGASPAIVSPDDGGTLSYDQLGSRVDSLAARLRAAGIGRGDTVALVLPNGAEFLEALFAIIALGAAAAPLNPVYTADEYAFYLTDLRPRLLLLTPGEGTAARSASPQGVAIGELKADPKGRAALAIEGRSVDRGEPFESASPDDIALLLHTSGTTSRPKQVPLLHRNLLATAMSITEHYRLGRDDVSYCVMPLFHVHGLVASVLAPLVGGGSVVVPRRLAPRQVEEHLRANEVTWFSAGPTFHHMLLERVACRPAAVPSLRFLRSCSSALPPALLERAEAHFGVPMLEAYGMTEASHQISSNPRSPAARIPGSVGIATGTDIRIVDRAGVVAPEGMPGEVQIRGPGLTPGYLNNPEANADSFVEGWFKTGDQGVLEDGYLRLQGRLKEMILRGGENISPYEVEDVLLAYPAVADAACFGVPDEKYGEEVAAAVALHAEATERELIDHCRERLAAFKVPKVVYVVEAIPRTPTGKPQRKRVAALVAGTDG
jgi:acyl-CoA synthetase (AMP-forming)/AMP-acid ligase II